MSSQKDDAIAAETGEADLPPGYRWATAEEVEAHHSTEPLPGMIMVPRTADSKGVPYSHDVADFALPVEAETEQEAVTHWGCQLLRPDGSVFTTRWDPAGEPYTETAARADVESPERYYTKRLVTRTETTVVVTTAWTEVQS